jgi:hypothetical protein
MFQCTECGTVVRLTRQPTPDEELSDPMERECEQCEAETEFETTDDYEVANGQIVVSNESDQITFDEL